MEQLREWLNHECEKRNLSWREASLRAGVYAGAVSAIMNGQRPGLDVCKALAQSFGTPVEYVLELAGHLPPSQAPDPRLQRLADQLIEMWREVEMLDPAAAERLTGIAVLQAEMVLAAARSAAKRKEREEQNTS